MKRIRVWLIWFLFVVVLWGCQIWELQEKQTKQEKQVIQKEYKGQSNQKEQKGQDSQEKQKKQLESVNQSKNQSKIKQVSMDLLKKKVEEYLRKHNISLSWGGSVWYITWQKCGDNIIFILGKKIRFDYGHEESWNIGYVVFDSKWKMIDKLILLGQIWDNIGYLCKNKKLILYHFWGESDKSGGFIYKKILINWEEYYTWIELMNKFDPYMNDFYYYYLFNDNWVITKWSLTYNSGFPLKVIKFLNQFYKDVMSEKIKWKNFYDAYVPLFFITKQDCGEYTIYKLNYAIKSLDSDNKILTWNILSYIEDKKRNYISEPIYYINLDEEFFNRRINKLVCDNWKIYLYSAQYHKKNSKKFEDTNWLLIKQKEILNKNWWEYKDLNVCKFGLSGDYYSELKCVILQNVKSNVIKEKIYCFDNDPSWNKDKEAVRKCLKFIKVFKNEVNDVDELIDTFYNKLIRKMREKVKKER